MADLADLPGLSGAKKIASRMISDPSSHAVLFYGAPGARQDELALALAKGWLCTSPSAEGACGSCQSCGAFERNSNPDFQLMRPFGPGMQIRQCAIVRETNPPKEFVGVPVRDFVRTRPLMCRHKVVVFQDAHRMNAAAANAFLKTLEEPQEFAKFILVTDSIGRLLPTIVSRCVAVACEMQEGSAVAPHLTGRIDPEVWETFETFTKALADAPLFAALKLSEDLEEMSEGLSTEEGTGRQAIADGLELLANLVSRDYPDRPHWIHLILQAHRRVLGNVQASRVLDALLAEMLA